MTPRTLLQRIAPRAHEGLGWITRLTVSLLLGATVAWMASPVAVAQSDPGAVAREAKKWLQQAAAEEKKRERQAAAEDKKRERQIAAEEKKRLQRVAAEEKRGRQQVEREAQQLAQREAQAARQEKARADSEARRQAAKEAFVQSCAPFEAWMRAGELPYFEGHRPNASAVVAMLRASRFEPHFGTRYEDLPSDALSMLSGQASRCLRSDGPLAGMTLRERTLVLQTLTANQQPQFKQLLARTEAAESMLAKLGEEALALQPSTADANQWVSLARQADAPLADAGTEAREAFFTKMKQGDTTAVAPVLPKIVDEAMEKAQGLQGIRDLVVLAQNPMNPPGRHAMSIMSPAGGRARNSETTRIRERIETLAAQLAEVERARIEAFGKGLVALQLGKAWHADYRSRLAPLAGHSRQVALLATHFREKREIALNDGQADFNKLILQAPDHDSVARLQSQYLMEEDGRGVTGTAMMAALAERRQNLDKQLALGRTALPQAEPAARPPAALADTPEGEPDEEVMYDLIHTVLVNATKRQNELMSQCSGGVRSNDMMMNQTCAVFMLYKGLTTGLTSTAPVPKILQFEKLGCAPASGRAGYLCDYTLAVEKQLHPAIVGPEAKALLEGSSLKSARFYKTRKGWVIFYSEDAVQ